MLSSRRLAFWASLIDPIFDRLDILGRKRGKSHRHPRLAALTFDSMNQDAFGTFAGNNRGSACPAFEHIFDRGEREQAAAVFGVVTLDTMCLDDGLDIVGKIDLGFCLTRRRQNTYRQGGYEQ